MTESPISSIVVMSGMIIFDSISWGVDLEAGALGMVPVSLDLL